MPFSHITDSDKQVLEMSDSTVPGKVQDKTVLPKVDTADMPLPDTTDFDKKVLEMSDSTLPGKLQDNSALPKVDTTDTSLPELAIPNQHERKRSSVSIQLPPTQPAPVYLNLDPVHRYGTIWNAPDPYDNAAKDKLRQDRRRVRHQLRLLFIYPLVYALMWVLPFAYHCLLYSDTYAKKPPPTTPAPTTAAAVRRPSLQKDYLSVDARQAYRRREAELADAVELQTLQRLARPASAKTTGKDWWEVTGGGEGDVEVGGANAA
ncbi:MAG: hypothetical protein M1833_005459 [Piccolia ochrophora]|nr:MAG: hypothetical protein M1833_005459 [Piccolia ochrophora]